MLRFCLDCTTAYAVELQFCPHCGSARHGYSKPIRVEDVLERGAVIIKPEPAHKPAPTRKDKA